jgi:head-tail adaptor
MARALISNRTVGPGDLDRTVTIQRATDVDNGLNVTQTWANFFTCRARRRDAADGEAVSADQLSSFLRVRFVIRSSSETRSVTPKDRIFHEGDFYNILGVKETNDGRGMFLEVTAVKKNDG